MRTRLGKFRFHEDMTNAAFDCDSAVLTNDLDDAARRAQVKDYARMRMRLQHIRHKPGEQQIATNRRAEFIEHDAAIRVAIETETCVKLAASKHRLQFVEIRFHQRIRLMHELAA